MGGLHQKPMAPRHVRRFRHAGKSYIAYESGVPGFRAGTLVATGYAVSVVADGHHPTPDELAAALDAVDAKRSAAGARDGT
jgi:hypothetical protein